MKKLIIAALVSVIIYGCKKDDSNDEPTEQSLEDVLFPFDETLGREASRWYYTLGVPTNVISYYFTKSYYHSEATGPGVKYIGVAKRNMDDFFIEYYFDLDINQNILCINKISHLSTNGNMDFFEAIGIPYIYNGYGYRPDLSYYEINILSFSNDKLIVEDEIWGKITFMCE